mmetsp:Transcript_20197/g.33794  ORF Transcript_20197/g.33794 Transcript_20197/m.33794 type:complete len:1357 (-) Transcript_20197:868-4938(-)
MEQSSNKAALSEYDEEQQASTANEAVAPFTAAAPVADIISISASKAATLAPPLQLPAPTAIATAGEPAVTTAVEVPVPVPLPAQVVGGGYYANLARRERSSSVGEYEAFMAAGGGSPKGVAGPKPFSRSRSNSVTLESTTTRCMPQPQNPEAAARMVDTSTKTTSSLTLPPKVNRQASDMTVESVAAVERDFSMLSIDSISAESFILTVRHASGVSADIDNDFLERHVYRSGALFLRYHVSVGQKTESKDAKKSIFVSTEQVGCTSAAGGYVGGGICQRLELKMRIMESRDEMVSEPLVPFGQRRESYDQLAFTRPGRRGGRRRGQSRKGRLAEIAGMDAVQLEQYHRQRRDRENRKSALMRARDIDYTVRYALLDPECFGIADVHNASADVLLVEQLHVDCFEKTVHFQCQALRSLAHAGFSNTMIHTDSAVEVVDVDGTTAPESAVGDAFNLSLGPSSSAAATGEDPLEGSFTTTREFPEKSSKMQLKALTDFLIGASSMVNDAKCTNPVHLGVFLRAEAAFALAKWQNLNAPNTLLVGDRVKIAASDDESGREEEEGDGDEEDDPFAWRAAHVLNESIYSLFVDSTTNTPMSSDFTNESYTHLRNAMLLALSEVHTKSGHSPMLVVNTLLMFLRHFDDTVPTTPAVFVNDRDDDEDDSTADAFSAASAGLRATSKSLKQTRSGGADPNGSGSSSKDDVTLGSTSAPAAAPTRLDDAHFKAVIYLALSRLRFDSVTLSTERKSARPYHPWEEISEILTTMVRVSFTTARASARIHYRPGGEANFLPHLPAEGLDIAAAITCLSEIDIHAVALSAVGRVHGDAPQQQQLQSAIERLDATGMGPFTGFDYLNFFLPRGTKMMCLSSATAQSDSPGQRLGRIQASSTAAAAKDAITYYLCTPAVRAAAFEAFTRLCFALDGAHRQRKQLLGGAGGSGPGSTNTGDSSAFLSTSSVSSSSSASVDVKFIPAAIEALAAVLKRDSDAWVRTQAALVFSNAVMDRPAYIAAQVVSCSNYWLCMGWSDPQALTLPTTTTGIGATEAQQAPVSAGSGTRASVSTVSLPGKESMKGTGQHTMVALKILWRLIFTNTCYEQCIRSILLSTWMYAFGTSVPPALVSSHAAAATGIAEGMMTDRFFDDHLPTSRLQLPNPNHLVHLVDQSLRYSFSVSEMPGYGDSHNNSDSNSGRDPSMRRAVSASSLLPIEVHPESQPPSAPSAAALQLQLGTVGTTTTGNSTAAAAAAGTTSAAASALAARTSTEFATAGLDSQHAPSRMQEEVGRHGKVVDHNAGTHTFLTDPPKTQAKNSGSLKLSFTLPVTSLHRSKSNTAAISSAVSAEGDEISTSSEKRPTLKLTLKK